VNRKINVGLGEVSKHKDVICWLTQVCTVLFNGGGAKIHCQNPFVLLLYNHFWQLY